MDFQKVSEAIENSSQEIKDLLLSQEVGVLLHELSSKSGIALEQQDSFIDEVGYIILGLKERSTLKWFLQKIGVPTPQIMNILQELNKEIFNKLDSINTSETEEVKPEDIVVITQENKKEALESLSKKEVKPIQETSNSNTESANLPVIEPDFAKDTISIKKDEIVHVVPHVETLSVPEIAKKEVAEPPKEVASIAEVVKDPQVEATNPTIPVQEPSKTAAEATKPTHNPHYPGGKDPYREPLV